MNYFILKIIALICMTIDHVGMILLPEQPLFRALGRIAFPLFAFLLVNGFYHTKNRIKYFKRLFIFAIISEIPFDLAQFGTLCSFKVQNIFFTLFLGMLLMLICEYLTKKYKNKKLYFILTLFCALVMSYIGWVLRIDYSWYGIFLIYSFYILYGTDLKHMIYIVSSLIILNFIYCYTKGNDGQLVAVLAVPFLIEFKEEDIKINKCIKIIIYWYYPIHLLILYIISQRI